MRIDITVRDSHGLCRDVAITAPDGSAVREVHVRLTTLVAAEPAAELWAGPRRLTPGTPLGGLGLHSGDVVSVGEPQPADPAAAAVLRLQVVSGPDAGQVVALPRGIMTIGRGIDCDLVLTDPDVSRRHASITVTSVGTIVRDLLSTNGTSVDGRPVDDDGTPLAPGAMLRVGDSFVSMCAGSDPAAAVRASAGGALLVNRPPRAQPALSRGEVQFPVRDRGRPPQRMQWVAAAVPALAGVGLALAWHSPQFLIFALMSPVVVVATALGDRLHWRRDRRRDATSFRQREASARADVVAGLAREIAIRRRAGPDPAALHDVTTAPSVRLWERRRSDADALVVRLGLADQTSALQARRGSDVTPAGRVTDVPVSVDLRAGPLGVAAPVDIGLGIARWLTCQLAVLHSPADVELALLLSDDAAASWAWTRWLPHLGGRIAATPDERQALVAELGRLAEQPLAGHRLDRNGWGGRWLVLVVDRARIDRPARPLGAACGRASGRDHRNLPRRTSTPTAGVLRCLRGRDRRDGCAAAAGRR